MVLSDYIHGFQIPVLPAAWFSWLLCFVIVPRISSCRCIFTVSYLWRCIEQSTAYWSSWSSSSSGAPSGPERRYYSSCMIPHALAPSGVEPYQSLTWSSWESGCSFQWYLDSILCSSRWLSSCAIFWICFSSAFYYQTSTKVCWRHISLCSSQSSSIALGDKFFWRQEFGASKVWTSSQIACSP